MGSDIDNAKNTLHRDVSFVSDLCLARGRNMNWIKNLEISQHADFKQVTVNNTVRNNSKWKR